MGRKIDRHPKLAQPFLPEAPHVGEDCLQDPFPDGNDQTVLLRDRDEADGGNRNTVRDAQTDQGLGSTRPARRHIDDRLVEDTELVILESPVERLFHGIPVILPLPDGPLEEADPEATAVLGLRQGEVGVADNRLEAFSILEHESGPEARRQIILLPFNPVWPSQGLEPVDKRFRRRSPSWWP